MAVTISVGGMMATIDGYEWTGPAILTRWLNAFLSPSGPSGADPDPDRTAANDAIAKLGGEVVMADEAPFVEGTIY